MSEAVASAEYLEVKGKLEELQQALLNSHPQLPIMLRALHTQLKNDPAVCTILKPEEIAIVVQGLEKQTNNHIAASVTKKPTASATKALKNVKIDDLF